VAASGAKTPLHDARPWSVRVADELVVSRAHINQPGSADRLIVSPITGSDS